MLCAAAAMLSPQAGLDQDSMAIQEMAGGRLT